MIILTPGHLYELGNFDKPGDPGQLIQFIEKKPASEGSTELVTVSDGTTNEEVLKVLIDRCWSQFNKFPSRETALAITRLEEALMWLEKRTRGRIARNVEGTHQA
jgi:hypothetical protein